MERHADLAVWLSLFPITFVIHFAEEFWCAEGYPAYLLRLRGVTLTTRRFLVGQAIGFLLFCAAGVIALELNFPEFMIVTLGGFVFANGLSHTVTAVIDRRYGPGLVSSAVLWMPLGVISAVAMFGRMSITRFAIALAIGLSINGIVALLTMRGAQLKRSSN